MQEIKKQLEILLVNYFRNHYPDFPKGKILASESPDFVVKTKSKHQLGIELTRLNPASALPKTLNDQAQYKWREVFVDSMQELFATGSDKKLFAKFLFSDKQPIEPERELAVRSKTVAAIRTVVNKKNDDIFFTLILNSNDLPEGVEQVMVAHHPSLRSPVWECSNNLGISKNVIADIRLAIEKKDEKLRLYKKQQLDKYWLLITTDCLRADKNINLLNKIYNAEFNSRFQQVLLFDLIRARVIPLLNGHYSL